MGTSPSDVQREIEQLRQETSWIVDELEYRARQAVDLGAQARNHPYVVWGSLSAAVLGLGFMGYAIFRQRQPETPSVESLRRGVPRQTVGEFAENIGAGFVPKLGDTLGRTIDFFRRRAPRFADEAPVVGDTLARTRGFFERNVARLRREAMLKREEMKYEGRQEDMVKRVLWAMFSAGVVAIFGLLARRVSASLWKTTMKERPPAKVY